MTDLHTRFRTLDSLSAPNLWPEIEERALAMQPTHRRRPLVLIAATLLLALVIGGAALVGSGIIELPVPDEPSPTPSSAPSSAAPSSTPDQAREPTWTATGEMIEASGETFTLLLDGTVLVTGGFGPIPDSPLTSAQLYDPSSGSWSTTGDMVGSHGVHAATRLLDGRVLVAGGGGFGGGDGPSTSAELYDPSSGSWSATGNMVEGHGGHLATLLLDGRVLVAGGGSGSSTSAELYDPDSGTWTATGSMIEVRADPTITLLRDGRVLVAGGQFFGLGTAELYDPDSGTWTAIGSMAEGRIGHTATLLPDGTVLVVGGYTNDSSGNFAAVLASAELYDPSNGTWTAAGSMIEARTDHTATSLPDGTVLVAGGSDFGGGTLFASAELYDPSTGSWTATASMIEARSGHTATLLLDGSVLVAGAGGGTPELYDPGRGT